MLAAIQNGGYRDVCYILCTFLHFSPSELFPTEQVLHYNHNKIFNGKNFAISWLT